MDTTETYLNLGSEQFNSWINEYENKYNKIEKTNINNSINSSSEKKINNDSDVEEYSDSEKNDSESIFISNDKFNKIEKKEVKDNIDLTDSTVTSSTGKRLLYNPRRPRLANKNSSFISGSSNLDSVNHKKEIYKSPEKFSNDKIKKNVTKKFYSEEELSSIKRFTESEENILGQINELKKIATMKNEKTLSLDELNRILPKISKENKIDNFEASPVSNENSKSKLGDKALYKYILMSRRR